MLMKSNLRDQNLLLEIIWTKTKIETNYRDQNFNKNNICVNMQFHDVFKRSNVIDCLVRVNLDHFDYLQGILEPVVNLWCAVIHDSYLILKGKLWSLPFLFK